MEEGRKDFLIEVLEVPDWLVKFPIDEEEKGSSTQARDCGERGKGNWSRKPDINRSDDCPGSFLGGPSEFCLSRERFFFFSFALRFAFSIGPGGWIKTVS